MFIEKSDIEKWLKENEIFCYEIKEDLTVDVHQKVDLITKTEELPVQFGTIYGSFTCHHLGLKTLKGCPHTVKGLFECHYNPLISLEYGPTIVTEYYNCSNTKITDSPQSHSSRPAKDDTMAELKETGFGIMKDVEKTGRGLMKDLGGFLDKSSNKPSKKIIKPAKKNQNFLVCDKCGGYYELQNGESADDFSHDCECGGHLELKNEHP